MRVGTEKYFADNVQTILNQQASIAKKQNQIATGVRVSTPSEDPLALSTAIRAKNSMAQIEQFERNMVVGENTLSDMEASISLSSDLMKDVKQVLVQSNNGTLGAGDRRVLAAQLRQQRDTLLGFANRKDSTGAYLFSGTKSFTPAFAPATPVAGLSVGVSGGAVNAATQRSEFNLSASVGALSNVRIFAGDGAIAPSTFDAQTQTLSIPENFNGQSNVGKEFFVQADVVQNGVSRPVRLGPFQVGTPLAAPVTVTPEQDPFVYQGTPEPNEGIEFQVGVSRYLNLNINGDDAYSIDRLDSNGRPLRDAQGRPIKENIFSVLDVAINALESGTKAESEAALGVTLQKFDQIYERLQISRTEVGNRRKEIEVLQNAYGTLKIELDKVVDENIGVDLTKTISDLAQQEIQIQATQKSFANVARLSLLDYL
jgi:flagellar hook-associated protein 3 FlgL